MAVIEVLNQMVKFDKASNNYLHDFEIIDKKESLDPVPFKRKMSLC